MNNHETLRAMLDQMIAGKEEQAAVTMHDYFVAKTREVTGMGAGHQESIDTDLDLSDDE